METLIKKTKTTFELIDVITQIDWNNRTITMLLMKTAQLKCGEQIYSQLKNIFQCYYDFNPFDCLSTIKNFIIRITKNNADIENLVFLIKIIDNLLQFTKEYLHLCFQSQNLDETFQIYISLPIVLRNLFRDHQQMNNYENKFMNNLLDIILSTNEFNQQEIRYILDRIVRQGYTYNIIKIALKNKHYLQLILQSLDQSLHRDKTLQSIYLNALDCKNYEFMALIIQQVNQEIWVCKNIILCPLIPPQSHQVIYDSFKLSDQQIIQNMIYYLLQKWGDNEFVKYAAKQIQLNVTNFLGHLLQSLQRKTLLNPVSIRLLNDGVHQRLNFFQSFQYIRKCAFVVQRHFQELLDLSDAENDDNEFKQLIYVEDQDDVTQINQQKVDETSPIQQNLPEDLEFIDLSFTLENHTQEGLPKTLYDCLCALRVGKGERVELAMKHLPYLIRKQLSDLCVYGPELVHLLLRIRGNDFWKDEYEENRKKVLIGCLIMTTQKAADEIISHFYSENCSLGDRHFILSVLIEGVDELSNNPQRYPVMRFDTYSPNENQSFYFQRVETKYYSVEQKEAEKKQQEERNLRINEKSRRWGNTLRKHQDQTSLKPIRRNDLLIYKSTPDDPTYDNRFNVFINDVYFPLLVPAPTKFKLLLSREPLLLMHFFQTITKFLDCAKFSFNLYKMIEETIDFSMAFKANKTIQVLRAKLQMWLKISVLLKQEILSKYPLLIEKILQILEEFNSHDLKELHDHQTRNILSIIYQNFKNLLNFDVQIK